MSARALAGTAALARLAGRDAVTDERWSVCVRCGCIFKPHVKALPCPACGGWPFGVRPLDPRGESLTNVIANTVTP